MDRFARQSFAACSLGLFLAASGCRSTQPEVPPGRPFAKDGQQRQAIQFSSDGHPATAQGSAPYMPNNLGGSNLGAGISTPGAKPDGMSYGGPEAAYGPPGSAGMPNQQPNLSDPATVRASSNPAPSIPLTGTPPAGTPPINLPPLGSINPPAQIPAPTPELSPPLNQPIPGSLEKPSAMGLPDPMPGPN